MKYIELVGLTKGSIKSEKTQSVFFGGLKWIF